MPRASSADKILEHATKMFAERGFYGTIMDELASSAKVNKATIYYHFKDKEKLYDAVVLHHLEQFVAKLLSEDEKKTSTLERLETYIKTFAQESLKAKSLMSIIMREIAGGGDKMPAHAKAQMHKLLMLIKTILLKGYEEGLFVKADVLTLHFMVLGTLSFYITGEPLRKKMLSPDANLQHAFVNSTVEEVAEELYMMIKNAIVKTKENV